MELILRRWGNEASRDDQILGQRIAGDLDVRGRGATIEALVDLVRGKPPAAKDAHWWNDVNP